MIKMNETYIGLLLGGLLLLNITNNMNNNISLVILIVTLIYLISIKEEMGDINGLLLILIISIIIIFYNKCRKKIDGGNNDIKSFEINDKEMNNIENLIYGGKEISEEEDSGENNELSKIYDEFIEDKKEYEDYKKNYNNSKNKFMDMIIEKKLERNRDKINEFEEKDKMLDKLKILEEDYKKLSKKIEGGSKNKFMKEIKRIKDIEEKLEKERSLYDLNKDGKVDKNDMPMKKDIDKYKEKMESVFEEEKENELFNLKEDSPILEEWSEAFKNNFDMKMEGGSMFDYKGLLDTAVEAGIKTYQENQQAEETSNVSRGGMSQLKTLKKNGGMSQLKTLQRNGGELKALLEKLGN